MSAIDLFARFHIDTDRLTALQRVLLVTDGTLTEILEAHFLERIELDKVSERVLTFKATTAPFVGMTGEQVLERKINLRGANSGTTYVHAESLLLTGRLSPQFQRELIETNVPLGRLWRHHRLETHKQLVSMESRPAQELSGHLGCAPDSRLLGRSYDVFSAGRPIMRISEFFATEVGT